MVPNRILRLPEVISRTGLSRSTVYREMERGGFPSSIKIGAKAVGWPESTIAEWIQEKITEAEQ